MNSVLPPPPSEPQPLPTPSTKWYFDKEQLTNTPSRRSGIDADKELTYRQQSANFIQDMGQRLQVNQLCINTAIVYMHRFYMYHSFQQFQKNAISTAAIFLAAKVEEQPRKLEYVIKIAHYCLYRDTKQAIDVKSDAYIAQSTELVSNENILIQTLGFDVSVDHPHTHVVKCCQLVRASKDLAQTSYFMATNSLHLTTMCLQYPPSVVACVCIHLACKWSNWEIPRSKEGREWYYYVDGSVTPHQLELLTSEFLTIFNKSPSRLKKRILNLSNATSGGSGGGGTGAIANFPTHFTVDRNSSGAQTIKSRSRTPSPPIGAQSNAKSSARPSAVTAKPSISQPNLGKPVKPVPAGIPLHNVGTKPGAPGIPLPGHSQAKHPMQVKSQYPHAQNQAHSHSSGTHGGYKDGVKLQMKPGQSHHPPHSSSNGSLHHGNRTQVPNHHPQSQSQTHSRGYSQMHHGHGSSQKLPIGSHNQSLHHHPALDVKPSVPVKTEPFGSALPPLSLAATFPLLSSEIGHGATSTNSFPSRGNTPQSLLPHMKLGSPSPHASVSGPSTALSNSFNSRHISNSYPQSLSLSQQSPSHSSAQIQNFNLQPSVPSDSQSSASKSSPKKKKKKKEHKHKKEKEDKEHRHKDKSKSKEEKKHKKDKHRDKDSEKYRPSKKKRKTMECGISHVPENSLKINIVTSKEAIDSKASRTASGKNLQSNTVVYY